MNIPEGFNDLYIGQEAYKSEREETIKLHCVDNNTIQQEWVAEDE